MRWRDRLRNNLGFNKGETVRLQWSCIPAFLWNSNLFWYCRWPRHMQWWVEHTFGWTKLSWQELQRLRESNEQF